jgi:hypothetical protein
VRIIRPENFNKIRNANAVIIAATPSINGRWRAYAEHTTIQATLAQIAIERHRLRHAEYPLSLEKVDHDLLPKLPTDLPSLHPLRYRRIGDGYILYSDGADGNDDGGTPAASGPLAALTDYKLEGTDAIFARVQRAGK